MQDEKELQQRLVAKLQQKYGTNKVIEFGGPSEYGVDLILILDYDATGNGMTEFGETIYIGIQLKKVDRMGASDIQTAIGQATVALGHEFPVNDQGIYLNQLYVMNYGEYAPAARHYLLSSMRTLKALRWFEKKDIETYFLAGTQTVTSMLEEDENG